MSSDLLPFATVVNIEPYDPPRRLWHMPNAPPGVCPGCETKIDKTKITFAGHDWHPDCFRCSLCRQPFNGLQCIVKDDLVLHEDCYKQCFCERCAKCCQLIDPQKSVQAIGRHFHPECFTCVRCGDRDATMQRFITLYGFPYCRRCFEALQDNFPKCLSCHEAIVPTLEHREFFFRGRKYFVHFPDCFKCSFCPNQLHVKTCCVYKDRLVCKDCFDNAMKRVCAECSEPIFGQGARMENIWWHPSHFVCSVCKCQLKTNTAVFNAGVLKCRTCAAEDRGKCGGCGKPVDSKGAVHACGCVWHGECLKCQMCNQSVLRKKFANIKGKPCCVECYERMKSEGRIDKRGQVIENPA